MGRLLRGRTALGIAAAGLGSLLVLLALVHTSPVRSRVLSLLLARLGEAGIDGRIERLDYNLFTLDVRLRSVVLAPHGRLDAPFLRADEIRIDLPWSILRDGLSFERIDVIRPRITVTTGANGSLNLPGLWVGDAAPTSPPRVRVGRVVVRDLGARWSDSARATAFEVQGLSLDLAPAGDATSGRVRLLGSASVDWRGRHTSVTSLDGRLRFDGSRLTVADLRLDMPEVTVRLDGSIAPLFGTPRLALSYTATLALAKLAPWTGLASRVSGRVDCTGQLGGTAADPVVSLDVASKDLQWAASPTCTIRGTARLSKAALDVSSLAVHAAGGAGA